MAICCSPLPRRSSSSVASPMMKTPFSSDISISNRIQRYYTHTPDVTFIPGDLQKSELDLKTGQEKERQLNLGGEASERRRQAEFGRGQKNSHVNFLPLSDSVFLAG
ncbi:hypothetical protein OROGR_031781 [Orobanche gracilis]